MRRAPHSARAKHASGEVYRKKTGRENGTEEKPARKNNQAFREMTPKKNQEEKTLSHR